MKKGNLLILIFFISITNICLAQIVPILDYSVNNYGQVELEIEAEADKYYLLTANHEPELNYETITSMTMGVDGNMIISEPLSAFSLANYEIRKYSIDTPVDTDGDGIDDVTEFNNRPTQSPLNFAPEIGFIDGTTALISDETFSDLAVVYDEISWAPFLNGQEFAKFIIFFHDTDEPEIYFINSNTHYIHQNFKDAIGMGSVADISGEIVYNPNDILSNGVIGSYSFNYSFGDAYNFEHTRRTYELLAANMPFLRNNFKHFIGANGENQYENNYKDDYEGSRLVVALESEVFADIDFIPFNEAEGYGFFKHMDLDENPGSRDIVLYDALPNSLPRVGGIITSVVQTPLSHVNLRAIQDDVPNAYIKNPLEIDSIANLLGNYIYYRVENDKYFIREASLDEVNEWYESIRPTEPQIPIRDLSQTSILPLDSIEFEMSTAFGAKCTNVAAMRSFGFPEGTIPDGFGIPFYFYDEFMIFNGFYDVVEEMIADPDFINDLETRIDMLKEFRKDIKDADMPQWMLDELQEMHESFPEGTSIRCRSSTNNEDLPGFSGAGLYTSKTQHPDEGHISKSVKQVYASMWNFRAYDERDFYRVDQYIAAMGILCHPNFEDEKSNGVGISIDPIFNTENTFYLNTQVGEALITNPNPNEIPEEILLNTDPEEGYFVIRWSNLVDEEQLVMGEEYLDLMRDYLQVIHDEFAILYNVVGAEGFGMDIEYKVTVDDQLVIKQARPWVSFWANIKATYDLGVVEVIEPQSSSTLSDSELVTVNIGNQGLEEMNDFEIALIVDGVIVETIEVSEPLDPFNSADYQFTIPQDFSTIGEYDIMTVVSHISDGFSANDTFNMVLNKLHLLDGGISNVSGIAKCGEEIEVNATVTNYGESTFNVTEIEVIVNGMAVDTFTYEPNIPYLHEAEISVIVTENLQTVDNEISLNLLKVNGQQDAVIDNNNSSIIIGLDSDHDILTFILNVDDYPQETSWLLYDELSGVSIQSGSLTFGNDDVNENICIDYNSCYTLQVFDSVGDGICCGYGFGDFYIVNAQGDTLIANNGDFGNEAEELICLGDACLFSAEVEPTNATDEVTYDGIITINPTDELGPYQYSIDGGENFVSENIFNNLAPGSYDVVVKDEMETCTYTETIVVEFGDIINIENIASNEIKVYPNPTKENLVIEIDENFNISGVVKVEIYNSIGVLIHSESISASSAETKTIISLKKYAPGSYIAKCYNQDFEKNFKVIKI